MNAYFKGNPVFGPRGPAGPDGNPIGTIISFMGITAPEDYLFCDGMVHNISDYPDLAAFFAEQFGSMNYFGGDGETTFAVPDMRNLFLRGYHGEAEEPLSGEIGAKQEATRVPEVGTTGDGGIYFPSGNNITPQHCDEKAVDTIRSFIGTKSQGSLPASSYITIRPVNMAVLYCIKAVESVPAENVYSTEEQRIGTWLDGKPLYQRTFTGVIQSAYKWTIIAEIPGMDKLVSCLGTALKHKGTDEEHTLQIPNTDIATGRYGGDGVGVYTGNSMNVNSDLWLTVTYTKTTD